MCGGGNGNGTRRRLKGGVRRPLPADLTLHPRRRRTSGASPARWVVTAAAYGRRSGSSCGRQGGFRPPGGVDTTMQPGWAAAAGRRGVAARGKRAPLFPGPSDPSTDEACDAGGGECKDLGISLMNSLCISQDCSQGSPPSIHCPSPPPPPLPSSPTSYYNGTRKRPGAERACRRGGQGACGGAEKKAACPRGR